jgi:hypothetical protein
MSHKVYFPLTVFILLLTACAGQPAPVETEPPSPLPDDPNATALPPGSEEPHVNPYAPAKGDEAMQRGEVFIDSQEILVLESFPLQFRLHVIGSLPTPCHELRAVVDEPDEQNRILVQIYSLIDPDMVCTQVLEPFDTSLSLGSYASGSYTVFVNGEEVGEITP